MHLNTAHLNQYNTKSFNSPHLPDNEGDGPTTLEKISSQQGTSLEEVSSVCRLWGKRPYQPEADNSFEAQKYWTEVAEVRFRDRLVNHPLSVNTSISNVVLQDLYQLNPGSGPGVPVHLPISFNNIEGVVTRIACGYTFVAFLTSRGRVYVVGHGLEGQLGLGPKVGHVREPQMVSFPAERDEAGVTFAPGSGERRQPTEESDDISASKIMTNSVWQSGNASPVTTTEGPIIVDVAAGHAHALALTIDGAVYVWGEADSCGLMTVDNLHTPVSLLDQQSSTPGDDLCSNLAWQESPSASIGSRSGPKRVVAIAVTERKSAMLTECGCFMIWGEWPGTTPMMKPVYVARLKTPDNGIVTKAKICIGENFGMLLIEHSDFPQETFVYQFGAGSRSELAAVFNPPDAPLIFVPPTYADARQLIYVPVVINDALLHSLETDEFKIIDIAVGTAHAIVMSDDGRLAAWGDNTWGQCGVGGDRTHRVSSPTSVRLDDDAIPCKIYSGGFQSAAISTQGQVHVWGCSQNHRLINSSARLLAEAPVRALSSKIASLGRASTIGTATQESIEDSVLRPERVIALTPFSASAIGIGQDYVAVASHTSQSRS